jgi:hypothetical protein
VNCNIYLPVVRVYADSRSTCFPLPELTRWNLVQSTKFLRVTVRSHVSTAPTMHESRHFIDPWTIDIISSFSLAIGTRWVQADILSSSFVVSLSFSRTLYSDEYKNSSCFLVWNGGLWLKRRTFITSILKVEAQKSSKAFPLQAWTGPWGSWRLRLQDF